MHKLRLLISGSDKIYAIENFYVKFMRELGINVFHYPAQSIFYDYYQENFRNKLLFKAGLSGILNQINKQFIEIIDTFKPDVILVFKGMEILPATLEIARKKKIKLVNYNPDSPFIFTGSGSGNKNITQSISLYDLFLTYNSQDQVAMKLKFNIPSEILPFGFNLDPEEYGQISKEPEKIKLSFLGNPDAMRAKFLDELAKLGLVIDVYGHHWKQFVNDANITVIEPVYSHQFWVTLRKYRVQLNLMRLHNPASHNMRTFEAGGAGAIQLAPQTKDHETYFEPGKEIFLFNSAEECFEQAKKLLSMSAEEAGSIRSMARDRSLLDRYSYKDRAAQAIEYINRYCA